MVALKDLLSFLSAKTTSLIQVSVCLQSLFSFSYPRPFAWFWFLLRNLWEGWRSFPLSLCMLSQLHTREGTGRDITTLVLLPKLSCFPPAGPPSLCPEPYSSHNEACQVNSHSAGHSDEDSVPLMFPLTCCSQQGQGQGFSWLADTCVLNPFKKRRGGMQELVTFPWFERQWRFHCMGCWHLSPFPLDSSIHLLGPGCLNEITFQH